MDHYQLFIDGEFVDAKDGATFESIDPGNETPIATVARAGEREAEAAIAAARRAFDKGDWSRLTPVARAAKIYDFADMIAQQSVRMAVTESADSGQVIGLSRFWGLNGSQLLRNLAYHAATAFPWEEEIPYPGNVFAPGRDFIRRESVGVCVGIIPWNFPLSMAFWKIGQSIIMGNTIVLKPASVTPLSAMIIAEAANAAGIPPGVINILNGPGVELGKVLCTHPDVDKIAFTGSTEVGRDIMRMASDTVKKVTLELGGSRPTSSSTTPMSTWPWRAPSSAPSSTRARCASRAPACWSHRRSATSSPRRWRVVPRACALATSWTLAAIWGRW